jgi:hypothetical protein
MFFLKKWDEYCLIYIEIETDSVITDTQSVYKKERVFQYMVEQYP